MAVSNPIATYPLARETSYGEIKRFDFVKNAIEQLRPRDVLDIGCGTGSLLTAPLAREFPDIEFLGVEPDEQTIGIARTSQDLPNLKFTPSAETRRQFDLVIASEVLEHVEDPGGFIEFLRGRLRPEGQLILTVPNGYGPMELASFFENILRLSGVFFILRLVWRLVRGTRPLCGDTQSDDADSLAVSPHLNFFSFSDLQQIFSGAGLRVLRFQPRTVFCGFGFDQLIRVLGLESPNARIADKLPAMASSDWMFLLRPDKKLGKPAFSRHLDTKVRRYMNEKRWKLN